MLFKLPTFALTLTLLSAQIQARSGPPALTNVGNLIYPSHGQTFEVGNLLPVKYQLDVPGPGPAYQIQLQHMDGSVISTFATDIVPIPNNMTGTIDVQFLVPKPHNISLTSGPVETQFVVLQRAPVEGTKYRYDYQLVQAVELLITV